MVSRSQGREKAYDTACHGEKIVLVESENFVCFSGISGLTDNLSEQGFLQGVAFSGV